MKKISAIIITCLCVLLTGITGFSQNTTKAKTTVIEPCSLTISVYKTTNLVFPYAIKSVDRGSSDVIAQKVNGVENILQVKAGKMSFKETNLTVITAEGKLYSFILNYEDAPKTLTISFSDDTGARDSNSFFSPATYNEAEIERNVTKVVTAKRTVHNIYNKGYGMKLQLEGVYIKDDVMYFRLGVENTSNINYSVDMLRFAIQDEKKVKRTASQEIEVRPLFVQGDISAIKGRMKQVIVFALEKFTIPGGKRLSVELMEKNSGRNLQLYVHNNTIVRARLLR